MLQIVDSIKGLITSDMIQQASTFLGEDSSKVSSGISSMIPGLLGSIMKKGDSPEVQSVLKTAGQNTDIQSLVGGLFSGQASSQASSIGGSLVSSLFGGNLGDFTSAISKDSGLSQNSSSKLITMIAPVVASVVGKMLTSGNLNIASLLGGGSSGESDSILSKISGAVSGIFGHDKANTESGSESGSHVMDIIKGLFK